MLSFFVGNNKVSMSFSFSVCITLLALLDRTGLLFISFIAVFLHEMGHFLALKLLRVKKIEISFILASIKISVNEQMNPKKSAIISIFGPLINLIFSSFVFVDCYYLKHFGAANIILFTFNMLPISNLDGGDILKYILCLKFKANGGTIFTVVSFIILSAFVAPLGVFFIYKYNNPTILLVCIYLTIISYKKV